MMMKSLILSGSERPGGNSEQISYSVQEICKSNSIDAEVIRLIDLDYHSCGSCGDCNYRDRPCSLEDDSVVVYEKMIAADLLVYVAPVHAFGLSSVMQQFLEKMGVCRLRFSRPLKDKVGLPIIVGRRYNHIGVHSQILQNMLLNRMIIAGSGYPTIVFAGAKGEAKEDFEASVSIELALERAKEVVLRMSGSQSAGLEGAVSNTFTGSERIHVDVPELVKGENPECP